MRILRRGYDTRTKHDRVSIVGLLNRPIYRVSFTIQRAVSRVSSNASMKQPEFAISNVHVVDSYDFLGTLEMDHRERDNTFSRCNARNESNHRNWDEFPAEKS